MRSDPGVNAMQTSDTGGMRLNADETAMLCGNRGAAARRRNRFMNLAWMLSQSADTTSRASYGSTVDG